MTKLDSSIQIAFQIDIRKVFIVRLALFPDDTAHLFMEADKLSTRGFACAFTEPVLARHPIALDFYEKWKDVKPENFSKRIYDAIIVDLKKLKCEYNFIQKKFDTAFHMQIFSGDFEESKLYEFSIQPVKKPQGFFTSFMNLIVFYVSKIWSKF